MIFSLKLRQWLNEAVAHTKETGLAQDVHIDDLFDVDFKTLTQSDIFASCHLISEKAAKYVHEIPGDISDIQIYLSIELIGESNIFNGRPTSDEEIIRSIDLYSVPEIIIYQEALTADIPLNEVYRVPVLMADHSGTSDMLIFYKEYRSLDDILNDREFRRELNIMIKRE